MKTRKRRKGGFRNGWHTHENAPDFVVAWAQGIARRMTGAYGFFYAGRIGSELKIGISQGRCPFCRINAQGLEPLGIAFYDDCRLHEANMKRLLGEPAHGAEFFDDWEPRFEWLVSKGFIERIDDIADRLAMRFG